MRNYCNFTMGGDENVPWHLITLRRGSDDRWLIIIYRIGGYYEKKITTIVGANISDVSEFIYISIRRRSKI